MQSWGLDKTFHCVPLCDKYNCEFELQYFHKHSHLRPIQFMYSVKD